MLPASIRAHQVRIAYYDLGDAKAENTVILTHGMSGWSCVGTSPSCTAVRFYVARLTRAARPLFKQVPEPPYDPAAGGLRA